MNKHRPLALTVAAVIVALAVAAVAAAGTGKKHTASVASLQKQVATLKAQNRHLTDTYAPAGIARQLAKVKAALDQYQSVDAAKAAGYQPASPCESTPPAEGQSSFGGVMGVHFVNPALMAPGPMDPTKPPILVYEPESDGSFTLVAAEYFKPDADQNTSTDNDRPSLFGRAFDGPMQGHAPGMPIHYDLHVWLWKHNPSGLFAPFNPAAHC